MLVNNNVYIIMLVYYLINQFPKQFGQKWYNYYDDSHMLRREGISFSMHMSWSVII